MVAPENAEEATKILIALPVDQGEADPESEQTERSKSLSLANAIGSGVIHGACLLPIVLLVVLILRLALSMLGIGVTALHLTAGQFLASVFGLTIDGVIWGAIVGVSIGILIWLLSAWRNDHPAGKIFIRLVMTVLCLPAALNL